MGTLVRTAHLLGIYLTRYLPLGIQLKHNGVRYLGGVYT